MFLFRKTILFIVLFAMLLTACGSKQIENPVNWPVREFTATNQDGKPFSTQELKGKIWLADFIFTNCTTVCSPMTARLASIQDMLKEKGFDVSIVSFSVDPTRDTPEVLKEFAQRFDADLSSWDFLTGYTPEEIKKYSVETFKSAVTEDPSTGQFGHGTSFFLVDQSGTIVKLYGSLDQDTEQKLLQDIEILAD